MERVYVRPVRARTTSDTSTIGWQIVGRNLDVLVQAPFKSQVIDEVKKLRPWVEIVDEEETGLQVVDRDGQPIMTTEVVGVMPNSTHLVLQLPNGKRVVVQVETLYQKDVADALRAAW